jgi:hypothetical protein
MTHDKRDATKHESETAAHPSLHTSKPCARLSGKTAYASLNKLLTTHYYALISGDEARRPES